MLSKEENELLTRVGPGTPMGNLWRRFWLPAILSNEITPDSPPVRLRILGEDLIAFRDTSGSVGITAAYCSHRRAPLYYGRNEECGIRCSYHGWKFDVKGHCIDMPNVNNTRNLDNMKARCGIPAYPTKEAGGVVWIYMGPSDKQPTLPQLEWIGLPEEFRHVSRWIQRTSYLQGVEGEIDSSHISFLHRDFKPDADAKQHRGKDLAVDGAPELTVHQTEYGFRYGSRRDAPQGGSLWRLTQWMVPMYSLIPKAPSDTFTHGAGRAWVPIDDNHTTTFSYNFRVDAPLEPEELELFNNGSFFPPRIEKGKFTLQDGYVIDTYLPLANKENEYLIDRNLQRTHNFTGIWGANEQDRSLQENMQGSGLAGRGIVDRTQEHLVGADIAIVTARKILLKLIKDLEQGIEPTACTNGDLYAVRAISHVTDITDFSEFEQAYGHLAVVPGKTETGPAKEDVGRAL